MITFAVLGAVTAYLGAKTEQETVRIAEKLAQGQLIEVGERQRLYTQLAAATALRTREDAVRSEGRELTMSAGAARREGRADEAAWLTMRAHEEFAAARAIKTFRDQFVDSNVSFNEENLRVTATLSDLGFGTFVYFQAADDGPHAITETSNHVECQKTGGLELSHIWCRTQERLEELHQHTRAFALAVAGFVLALTFFTVSDASAKTRWPQLKWSFLSAGLAMGALSASALVWEVPDTWPWLLGGLVATPIVWLALQYVIAFAERRKLLHPEKTESAVHSEEVVLERTAPRLPGLGHHNEHWFGVTTVVLIAVTVFVSALVSWGYSVASTHADAAAEEARGSAAEMVIRTAQFASRQSELIREMAAAAERRNRLGLANQRVQLSSFGGSIKSRHSDEETRHADELRKYKSQFENLDEIMDLPNMSADEDPQFPSRLLWQFLRVSSVDALPPPVNEVQRKQFMDLERAKRSRNAFEAFAQWDVKSGQSVAWRNVATKLLGALTVFAICLYFLGQAMAMEPTRSGYVLLTAGIVFGCFGIGSSIVPMYPMMRLVGSGHVKPEAVATVMAENKCPAVYSEFSQDAGRSDELAAYFYGVGHILWEYDSDDSDLKKGQAYLTCALLLREDFAYARLKLASINTSLRSLDVGEPYMSLPGRDSVTTSDYTQARTLLRRSGLDISASQRNSLAFNAALKGLIDHDEKALSLAEAIAQRALALVKDGKMLARPGTAAMLHGNLGFVHLASGNFETARQAYEASLAADSSDRARVSALTDLEIVTSLRCEPANAVMKFDCEGLRRTIVEIRKVMLSKQGSGTAASSPRRLAQDDFTATVTANHLSATIRGPSLESDDLWLVWSRVESHWNAWRTLQRVSRPIKVGSYRGSGVSLRDGTTYVQNSFVNMYQGTKECLGSGQYRADLYSHGELLETIRLSQYQE